MAAAGMQPMATMPHSRHVPRFSTDVFLGENGFSLWKYRMSTAMMAPSWMTTKNSSRNSADTFSFTNSSTRIMWPVEEMGSHSVMPSTTPMKNAFRTSMNMSTETASVRFACLSAQAASGNPGQSAPPTRGKAHKGHSLFRASEMLSRHCESSGFLRRKSTFVTLVYRGAGQPSARSARHNPSCRACRPFHHGLWT